ncbi:hypothetical protein [Hymenobacter koreensis]|uniref:Uncharacterized protein n=1 Tax=Hymenobacter koreensis TaxID=1084523 RepID=A0ABP8ITR0_9BACT
MRKHILIVALLTMPAAGAWAQSTPVLPEAPVPPPAVAAMTPPRVAPDSIDAVRNLFRKRRNGGTAFTAVGSLVLLRGVLTDNEDTGIGPSAVVAAPLLAVGLSKLVRFGSKKEEAYIKAYQQGRPLPKAVRRRLQPDYFRPVR